MARPRQAQHVEEIILQTDGSTGTKRQQIRAALVAFIDNSEPGNLVPSERVLAERLSSARMTVRQCLVELERDGLVQRIPGRGTYVAHRKVAHSRALRSFTDDMRMRGLVPGSQGLRVNTGPADEAIATALEIGEGDAVIRIERVRTADGSPMALERTWVAERRFPGLADMFEESRSLYDLLEVEFETTLVSGEQRVTIMMLNEDEAALLEVEQGAPAFLIERTTRDIKGLVAEYGRPLYRGDRYQIEMEVSRSD